MQIGIENLLVAMVLNFCFKNSEETPFLTPYLGIKKAYSNMKL
jgi:hypothetical protein